MASENNPTHVTVMFFTLSRCGSVCRSAVGSRVQVVPLRSESIVITSAPGRVHVLCRALQIILYHIFIGGAVVSFETVLNS